jgi:hypothetical protein
VLVVLWCCFYRKSHDKTLRTIETVSPAPVAFSLLPLPYNPNSAEVGEGFVAHGTDSALHESLKIHSAD